MELSLNALVEQLDELFSERASRAFRIAAGIASPSPLDVPELPELARLEAWQVVNEVLTSPRVDEAKRGRLTLLRQHVARAWVETSTRDQTRAIEHLLKVQTFEAAGSSWTLRLAARELPRMASRDGRHTLEGESSRFHEQNATHALRRIERARESIDALKLTPALFVELLHGRPLEGRAHPSTKPPPTSVEQEQAVQAPSTLTAPELLRETAAPHLDVLAYALKKVDPLLTPKRASEHDVKRALFAPWLLERFGKEDLTHAVTRCLGDLGLSPNSEGRLTVDTEARPGRDPQAACFELKVPDSIRLVLTMESGVEAYAGWLSTWGLGIHRSNVNRALPFVERRLGDRAVPEAIGLLFESFLTDEGWLKRYLRLTANQAREVARVAALRQLHTIRREAALTGFSLDAMSRGPNGLMDEFRARMSEATGVETAAGEAPFSVDPTVSSLVTLDAFALEAVLRAELRERFNEDFWRNPAAGRWVLQLASRGQSEDALAVSRGLGRPLSYAQAATERVTVMAA